MVTPTGIENLGLVSGALDHLDAANPRYAQKMRFLRHVQQMDVDYAILDLGAGTHANVLDFFLVSDHGVLVLVPEPTAVENAYRFVKAAFWRRMRNVAQVYGYDPLLKIGDGRRHVQEPGGARRDHLRARPRRRAEPRPAARRSSGRGSS